MLLSFLSGVDTETNLCVIFFVFRSRYSQILDEMGIEQAPWRALYSVVRLLPYIKSEPLTGITDTTQRPSLYSAFF